MSQYTTLSASYYVTYLLHNVHIGKNVKLTIFSGESQPHAFERDVLDEHSIIATFQLEITLV